MILIQRRAGMKQRILLMVLVGSVVGFFLGASATSSEPAGKSNPSILNSGQSELGQPDHETCGPKVSGSSIVSGSSKVSGTYSNYSCKGAPTDC